MPCTGEPFLNTVDYESGEQEGDLYDEENQSLLGLEDIDGFDNTDKKLSHNDIEESDLEIDFSNILRDVPEVDVVSVNKSLPPRLVSVNVTANSLTWVVGRQDHNIAAEKYQV